MRPGGKEASKKFKVGDDVQYNGRAYIVSEVWDTGDLMLTSIDGYCPALVGGNRLLSENKR